jgi:hypothetical protein
VTTARRGACGRAGAGGVAAREGGRAGADSGAAMEGGRAAALGCDERESDEQEREGALRPR